MKNLKNGSTASDPPVNPLHLFLSTYASRSLEHTDFPLAASSDG